VEHAEAAAGDACGCVSSSVSISKYSGRDLVSTSAALAVLAVQVYDLLNALEDRLGVNNSAVVLATIKVRGHSSNAPQQQHCTLVRGVLGVSESSGHHRA
jgi:hypothetical protein